MSVPAAYAAVVLIWSTTPLAIQWSALGAGYTFALMARMVIGVALALALMAAWRMGMPWHRRARRSYVAGGLGLFGAMLCTYWGAQYVHSGLVSVLFGLTPLVTGALAVLWLDEPALTRTKVIGTFLGLAGLAVIFGIGEAIPGEQAAAGMTALLVAVFIYSASLVWVKRIGDDSPPLATTAGTLLVAVPLFVLTWVLLDGRVPSNLPVRTGAAIVYLGVFGSVLGFALYFYVIKHLPAAQVALITLVTPVLALLLGHTLNGEAVQAQVWGGAGLIGLGLAVHQGQGSWLGRLRARVPRAQSPRN